MGNLIVSALILGIVFLALRSLWRNHKAGKSCSGCSGDCVNCKGHH